jgi:hypothetical protein
MWAGAIGQADNGGVVSGHAVRKFTRARKFILIETSKGLNYFKLKYCKKKLISRTSWTWLLRCGKSRFQK